MKLGLLGYPINHSKSPELYKRLLSSRLTSYELFSFKSQNQIPPLNYFQERLDGLNITSPYKRHFFDQVLIESDLVRSLGAINTVSFNSGLIRGTNTDLLAVLEILKSFSKQFINIKVILLGDGVMANVTKVAMENLSIPFIQLSRKINNNLVNFDLSVFYQENIQNIIINSCSRDFIFQGSVNGDEIFWDYNYSFEPHQKLLPLRLKTYQDGQLLLEIQAREAIKFWTEH